MTTKELTKMGADQMTPQEAYELGKKHGAEERHQLIAAKFSPPLRGVVLSMSIDE